MSFADAVRAAFHRYFSGAGRASRSEFWWFFLLTSLVTLALLTFIVATVVGAHAVGGATAAEGANVVAVALAGALMLMLTPAAVAVGVRRLHDSGYSGWWYLLGFLPGLGLGVLVLMALPGTTGANRYGSPRHPGSAVVPPRHRGPGSRPTPVFTALVGAMFGLYGALWMFAAPSSGWDGAAAAPEALLAGSMGFGFLVVSVVWLLAAAGAAVHGARVTRRRATAWT